jgi:predicted Rossmann-fold nucleotide-binding protein
VLATHDYAVIYGGGATGSMGALADGVVTAGGTITATTAIRCSLCWHAVAERFMHPRHVDMWQTVAEPEDVPHALASAPEWSAAARVFAQLQ